MTANQVRQKYIDFFVAREHKQIPSAPLVPENDPTTLFTSCGMQPLVPYLLGEKHPLGKRLVNSQKSFRSQDIEEVGDNRHTTFFEMLGNWSLGSYFKQEQLNWIFEFITSELGLDPHKLYITVFAGGDSVPKDTESISIWQNIFSEVGINALEGERIFAYGAKENWWSRSGEPEKMPAGEPGGPDSEVFYDFGIELKLHENSAYNNKPCHPNCECGRFLEIANSVFMQYKKQKDGSLVELPHKNVDFGGGLERMVAATQNSPDVFQTDLFTAMIRNIEVASGKKYSQDKPTTEAMRIICDHIKASVMMMTDGVLPSNKLQGYVLRRLIRRSLLHARKLRLSSDMNYLGNLVEAIAQIYEQPYPQVAQKIDETALILKEEALRFGKSLEKGLKEIEKLEKLDGKAAFKLYETYGFPWEMTEEIARERDFQVKKGEFEKAFTAHKQKSRKAAKGMFKGGLADKSKEVIALHTATHLLHQALRNILGTHVRQKGSNITASRLRFDFSHSSKVSEEEIYEIEREVNEVIKKDLPVTYKVLPYQEAVNRGALAFFGEKYPEKVKVYTVGDSEKPFSSEICGGPHVKNTGKLGTFKITKEESLGTGIRRIYAQLK